MLKLRRVDIERGAETYRRIEGYVEALVKRLDPRLVILFGSFATGDINEGSDIDILVVADFKEGFLDRIKTLMDMNKFKIPVEAVGYTPEEFVEMKGKGNPFIMEVIEKGRVMHES